MDLPVRPSLAPMLARLARALPSDGFVYEPKWDGFRCVAYRDGDEVDLRSRHGRPLSRYFPELVTGLRALPKTRIVLDGEILVIGPEGADFSVLMSRLHPAASRAARLARESPASFVAFDLVAEGSEDLRAMPFALRRERLERALAGARAPIHLTPVTSERRVAEEWLARFVGGGIDGVVAKREDSQYQPGKRAMVKVKRERTLDCVVAGFRLFGERPLLGSLLLGLYDDRGELRHIGVVASFTNEDRERLLAMLDELKVPLAGHPWEHGFALEGGAMGRLAGAAGRWTPDLVHDWVPVRPDLVCEVTYDQVDGIRLRHPARFKRWRPDRTARSCTTEQLLPEVGDEVRRVLATGDVA